MATHFTKKNGSGPYLLRRLLEAEPVVTRIGRLDFGSPTLQALGLLQIALGLAVAYARSRREGRRARIVAVAAAAKRVKVAPALRLPPLQEPPGGGAEAAHSADSAKLDPSLRRRRPPEARERRPCEEGPCPP